MVYRNIKTGAEIFSKSVIHAPGFELVESKTEKAASYEESLNFSPHNAEAPETEEPPKKEQPKKKPGTKKKGTKK